MAGVASVDASSMTMISYQPISPSVTRSSPASRAAATARSIVSSSFQAGKKMVRLSKWLIHRPPLADASRR
jgi:hypothetical protein